MRLKIFIYTFLTVVIISIIQGIFSYETYKSVYLEENRQQLSVKINEIEKFIRMYGIDSLNKLYSKGYYRTTIIDSKGYVLFDSEADKNKMENHLNREEIIKANQNEGKICFAIRKSKTLNHYFLYAAKKIRFNSVSIYLRASVLLDKIAVILKRALIQTLKLILISIVMGLIFTIIVSNLLNQPLKKLIALMEDGLKRFHLNEVKEDSELRLLTISFSRLYQLLEQNIEEINRLNQQLNILLNSIDLGIIFFDSKKRIVAYNLQAERIFGTKFKKGSSLLESVRVYDLYAFLADAQADEIKLDVYLDNKTKTLKITKKFIKYQEDLDEGIILIIDDITQLKKLEKMRTDFVANVSHELKTPLTSIKGFVETLKEGAVEDTNLAMKFLNIIEVEVERLTRLISDLLYLSEIENTKMAKTDDNIDVLDVLNECIELLTNKAKSKNVSIKTICEDNLCIKMNRDLLKQVFINLIDNAIMYNKENGKVEISICKQGDKTEIRIKDTGIGIPQEEIERIFERFYRVDKGRSRKLGGTGLGLSIVKHIVQLYNGLIEVKSEVGKGSEFIIKL